MGYPLPNRAALGRVDVPKCVEIFVKPIKNNKLMQNEAVYVYKYLTKCISNAVPFGKKNIKKRVLAQKCEVVYSPLFSC
ncbi:hypothetical protein EHJ13_04925 [Cronobacter dublinensis]|uniref:Uncharacterized protein n=1 Tax=Cronobacter dublinensis TaxID=413497 RepID=A0A9Q4XQD8_9ENTR|nr:hypothetical protein [Cronobacter dublinensis]